MCGGEGELVGLGWGWWRRGGLWFGVGSRWLHGVGYPWTSMKHMKYS